MQTCCSSKPREGAAAPRNWVEFVILRASRFIGTPSCWSTPLSSPHAPRTAEGVFACGVAFLGGMLMDEALDVCKGVSSTNPNAFVFLMNPVIHSNNEKGVVIKHRRLIEDKLVRRGYM